MTNIKSKACDTANSFRFAECYNMQVVFDELYKQAKNNATFSNLLPLILKEDNIMLAYRKIKTQAGSHIPGIDNLTINDLNFFSKDELLTNVKNKIINNFSTHAVKIKSVYKHNGDKKLLGIPSIWDRLIQQCIKQILEPICEAKFNNHSYGCRPIRFAENAIAETYRYLKKINKYRTKAKLSTI